VGLNDGEDKRLNLMEMNASGSKRKRERHILDLRQGF